MIYVFLADGFEEIEALTVADVLRRAKQDVKLVSIAEKTVSGSHGISVVSDCVISEITDFADAQAIVLPGGMPGTKNLDESAAVREAVKQCYVSGGVVAAICAAPLVLGHIGLLNGKTATCYPGFENDLYGATIGNTAVCEDGRIITGNGPAAALKFAFTLVAKLCEKEIASEISSAMIAE